MVTDDREFFGSDSLQAGKTTNSNTIEARKTLGLTMEIGVSTAS